MLIGYMRISIDDDVQTKALQYQALLESGVPEGRIYQDIVFPQEKQQPALESCLQMLHPGNILVIWKLNILAHSFKHLVTITEELRERGIGLRVLNTGRSMQIDTTTDHGELVFEMLAIIADLKKELNIESTKEGIRSAKERGQMGGRPRKMDETKIRIAMAAMSDPKSTSIKIAKTLGITTATLYKHVNPDGTLKEPGLSILKEKMS